MPRAWPHLTVAAILLLNVADAAFTIAWTSAGMAQEANPLMVDVLTRSPVLFMVAKIALVSLGVFLLFRLRARRLAAAGILSCACVYAVLLAYHVSELPSLFATL